MVEWIPYKTWSNGALNSDVIRRVSEHQGGIIMWAIVYDDGSFVMDAHRDECCARIDQQPRKQARYLYTSLRTDARDQVISKWWWNNLLNPDTTLWPDLLTEVEVYEGEGRNHHVFRLGITDSTLFREAVNLMIATRQASEHPSSVERVYAWHRYMSCTFSEACALSLMKDCPSTSGFKGDNVGSFLHGHSHLSQQSLAPRLVQRKPLKYPTLFRSNYSYDNDDAIWGATFYKDYDPYKYNDRNLPLECDTVRWVNLLRTYPLIGKKEVTSVFALRTQEEAKATKIPIYDISNEEMLKLLRSFELKDLVPKEYDVEVDNYDEDDDDEFDF